MSGIHFHLNNSLAIENGLAFQRQTVATIIYTKRRIVGWQRLSQPLLSGRVIPRGISRARFRSIWFQL